MGCSKNSSKREVYSDTGLLQETRKIRNKQPNITSKVICKRINKAQSHQKKKKKKRFRERKNNIETKKLYRGQKKKISGTKSCLFF